VCARDGWRGAGVLRHYIQQHEYTIFNSMNTPATDQDFIQLAKQNMEEDDYSADAIATATFRVRES
jgi:hypothetical protein